MPRLLVMFAALPAARASLHHVVTFTEARSAVLGWSLLAHGPARRELLRAIALYDDELHSDNVSLIGMKDPYRARRGIAAVMLVQCSADEMRLLDVSARERKVGARLVEALQRTALECDIPVVCAPTLADRWRLELCHLL